MLADAGGAGILDALVSGPGGTTSLREQARTARAVATCSCGWPSIWLDTAAVGEDDGTGHTSITAVEQLGDRITHVTLPIVGGRLFELEIFADATSPGMLEQL